MGRRWGARRLFVSVVAFAVLLPAGFATTAVAGQLLPNLAPVVALTEPSILTTFTAPATITVRATATDIDGTVAIVEFYAGAALIGSDASSPYSVTWTNVPAGTYSLTARARDNAAASTTSLAQNVTVTAAPNQAPAVSLTAPADGASFTAPATIAVSATANDSDGTVTTVEFYQGTTLIGSDTTNPYSVSWSSVPAGTYSVTAVARDDDGSATTSPARSVTVSAPNQAPTITLTAPANGATFTAPATITVSATAGDSDGTVTTVEFYAGATLIGSDTASPYSVTWSNVPAGTYQLTAVAADDDESATTSAVLTVIVHPPNQPPAVSLTAPANGAAFTAPATITVSATADDTDGTVTTVEFYAGTTLIGSDTTNPYGITWNHAPAGSHSLTAVARDDEGARAASAPITVTVAAGLPSGWTAEDIGAPPAAGSTQFSEDTYTLAGAGEVGGSEDQFHFAYRQVTGDVDIRARVVSIEAVDAWSKAGVMLRESLASNAALGLMFISASSGSAFHQRLSTGAPRLSTTGTTVAAPYWVRLERRGSQVTASQSSDGMAWVTVATMTLSQPTLYVGLVVASGDASQLATGRFDNVLVGVPAPNQPPAVTLTAPANGATFTAPATIAVSASASDTDGTVTTVEFYAGTTLIGSDTTSPYDVTWSNVAAGSYQLTAVARDNAGSTTTSAARTVTVTAAVNQPPAVSLTAPANGATFTAPAAITVSATASDSDGTVATVEFYAGATLIGSDSSSPYSITWNNVAAGSYPVTARARDNAGTTTTSPASSITVNAANQVPNVSLTAPADGTTFTAPATITLSATASDADGTVSVVEFYQGGTTLIGSDSTNPYGLTWNNVPAGSYQLTAVARDNASAMTVSSTTTITVSDSQQPTRAIFTASADHDTNVDYYVVEVFPQGANPQTANAVAAQNIGKPPVVNGECEADVRAMIESLSAGSYIATVSAFNSNGSARSTASAMFTR